MPDKLFVLCESEGDSVGLLGEWFSLGKFEPIFVSRPNLGKTRFNSLEHVAFISLGGSGMGKRANKIEKLCLSDAIANRRPILAICQGAQMLAELRRPQELYKLESPHIGVSRPRLILGAEFDPLIRPIRQLAGFVVNNHKYAFVCPEDAEPLAVSGDCTHCEAFRVNAITYGLQFHPEIPEADLPFRDQEWKELVEPEHGAYRRTEECNREILRAWFDFLR